MPTFPEQRVLPGRLTSVNVGIAPPGVTINQDFSTVITLGKSQSGSNNPNFRDTIKRGGDATGNYDLMVTEVGSQQVTAVGVPASPNAAVSFTGYIGGMGPYTSLDSSIVSKVVNEASAKALSRMRSGFSAGTVLGELKQTLKMVRSPANGLRKLTDNYISKAQAYRYEWLRRGMSERYRRYLLSALPDLYLEFQFGWKPLASDIESGIEAVSRAAKSPKGMMLSGTSKLSVTLPRTLVASYNNFPTSAYQLRVERAVRCDYSARVKGRASLKLGFGMPAFQAGSTIPDMVPTLWNLAPWSFLLDYFGNVGQVLEAQATASLVKCDWGCSSMKCVITTQNFVRYSNASSSSSTSSKCVHFQRRKITGSFPIPSISFEQTPSQGQSMNIGALVAGFLADKKFGQSVPRR